MPKAIQVSLEPLTIEELTDLSEAAECMGDSCPEDKEAVDAYRLLASRCRALALQLQLTAN